jgi:hypothetical protein
MTPTNIEQGARLPVKADFYEGSAGVIVTMTGGQFACRAKLPSAIPVNATIDGRAATITSLRASENDGRIIVARFVWAEENEK